MGEEIPPIATKSLSWCREKKADIGKKSKAAKSSAEKVFQKSEDFSEIKIRKGNIIKYTIKWWIFLTSRKFWVWADAYGIGEGRVFI